jgi:phosphoenolpyruvate carboxykinase (GTP)
MGDYFAHWLKIGEREGAQLPKIFMVNWFRKDDDGRFLWPGFGENSRVLAWVFRRCDEEAEAIETPIGRLPAEGSFETEGLDVSPEDLRELLSMDPEAWAAQLPQVRDHLARFGDRLPEALRSQLAALESQVTP